MFLKWIIFSEVLDNMAELQIMQRTVFYFMIIVASIVDIESQTTPNANEAPAELNTGLVSIYYNYDKCIPVLYFLY